MTLNTLGRNALSLSLSHETDTHSKMHLTLPPLQLPVDGLATSMLVFLAGWKYYSWRFRNLGGLWGNIISSLSLLGQEGRDWSIEFIPLDVRMLPSLETHWAKHRVYTGSIRELWESISYSFILISEAGRGGWRWVLCSVPKRESLLLNRVNLTLNTKPRGHCGWQESCKSNGYIKLKKGRRNARSSCDKKNIINPWASYSPGHFMTSSKHEGMTWT